MIQVCSQCGAENRLPLTRLGQVAKCGRCKTVLPPVDKPVELTSTADFQALVAHAPVPVLVDFWAAWCGPCRAVAPELEKLAKQRAGKLLIAKVDTERLSELAGRFSVRSIPLLIRFDGGRETKRTAGAMRAEQLVEAFSL